MITVQEFLNLMIDDCFTLRIWSNTQQREVWSGRPHNLPYKYAGLEVMSIDVPEKPFVLGLNIEEEE